MSSVSVSGIPLGGRDPPNSGQHHLQPIGFIEVAPQIIGGSQIIRSGHSGKFT